MKDMGIQRIVSRWAMQFPEWRSIKELRVVKFNYFHSVGYVQKSLFNGNTFYILFMILYPPVWLEDIEPTVLSIREFTTFGRCELAYMAITEP